MPQTATAPLPLSPASGARNAREQERGARPRNSQRNVSIEERTAVLEARWEETIPTLATKTDLSNLENRLLKWGIGAALGIIAVGIALFTHSATRMDNALAAHTARMDNAIAELKTESRAMNARIDRLDARIDRLDEKLDARFDALIAEIRALGRAQ